MSIDSIQIGNSNILKAFLGNTLIYQKVIGGYSPLSLFTGGKKGALLEFFDIATLFQDAAGSVLTTKSGDPVGKVVDKSGNNTLVTQTLSAARPIYNNTPPSVVLDKVDDALVIQVPTGGWVGTMVLATMVGTASYGVNIPAGSYSLGGRYFPSNKIVGAVFRHGDMTEAEKISAESYFVEKGAVAGFSKVINFSFFWRDFKVITSFPLIDTSSATDMTLSWASCSSLTSFPLIDTSSVTNMYATWNSCSSLTSFPLIDTSSATNMYLAWYGCSSLTSFPLLDTSSVTNISVAWSGCSSLTNFPANMFDNIKTGNFSNAFASTKLSQTSIDGILVSLVTSGIVSGPRVFNQSGGSAPSTIGTAAIDTLRARGWVVSVTGGY